MSSTNKTNNYKLSQFLGTDHFSFLTDYNQDMQKIDTGLASATAKVNTMASDVTTLMTEQESNNSNFEKTSTAIQNLNSGLRTATETLSSVQVTQNEHDTDITDLKKKVSDIETQSKTITLGTSNVTNGTSMKYAPIIDYDPNLHAIRVRTFSVSASSDLKNFHVTGSIDITGMTERDKTYINTKGIEFECGSIAYRVSQTIDGNNVDLVTYVPVTCRIVTEGSIRDAIFGIKPISSLPNEVVTEDGVPILSYGNSKIVGHGIIMS